MEDLETNLQSNHFGLNKFTWKLIGTALVLSVPFLLPHLAHKRRTKSKLSVKPGWNNLPKVSIFRILRCLGDLSTALEKISEEVKKQGPIFRTKWISEEIVVLNSPESGQHLLKSKELGHLPKPSVLYSTLHDMLGNGVLVSQGEFWHSQRKLLSKGFTYGALRGYTKIYNKCVKRFVNDLGKMFEGPTGFEYKQINTMLHLCGIKIITEVVMGLDTWKDKEEAERVADCFTSLKNITFQRFRKGLRLLWNPIWKLHPLYWEYSRNLTDIDNVIKKLIVRSRTFHGKIEPKGEKSTAEHNKNDGDDCTPEFDNMLELMYRSGLTETQIVAEVKTMIWAGYETTSTSTHFLLFLLALNKNHQNACREEVDRIFNDTKLCPTSGELTLEALSEMKHLERCFFETLRIIPVVGSITRKLESPLKIPGDTKLQIPAGVSVNVPIGLYHKLPEYFPNPERFDPDRFLPENSAMRPPYSFVPFSAGPRNCIGLKFAILEAKTVVAYMLRRFEIHTSDRFEDIALLPALVCLPERDYYFLLKERDISGKS